LLSGALAPQATFQSATLTPNICSDLVRMCTSNIDLNPNRLSHVDASVTEMREACGCLKSSDPSSALFSTDERKQKVLLRNSGASRIAPV
jgi:hypothetical protein